jgi:hypothetical protein
MSSKVNQGAHFMKSKTTSIVAIMALSSALAGYGEEASPREERDTSSSSNKWKVQVGWVHQFGRGMSVRGPKPMPSTGGRLSLNIAPGLTYPDNSAVIDREFDNGFVRQDLWTGDPSVPAERQGMTWYWSASASQYNYDSGNHPTLTFSRDQGEYVGNAYTTQRGGTSDDDMPTDGIEVIAKRLLHSWTTGGGTSNEPNERVWLDMNLVVGLAWFPSAQQRHTRAMGQDVYSLSENYTYLDYYGTQAGGNWGPLPLPYTGTYGTVGGNDAGPLIPVTPESAELLSAYQGTYTKSVNIKSKLWRLRGAMGLDFSFPLTERLSVYVAPQAVLEFVDMSVDRTETDSVPGGGESSRADHEHKMAVYPGVLLTAGANYQLTTHWYLGASAGYEWLFVDPSLHVGPDKITYDLSGGELSAFIGYSF